MKKYDYILLLFLLIKSLNTSVEAQQLPGNKYKYSSEFMRKAKTIDLLYINDSIACLMSKSPMEVFPDYKDLYASYKLPKSVRMPVPYGTEVSPRPNANYQVIWHLRDSILYLSDIVFYNVDFCNYKSIFPNNEQYKLIEKLTKVDFDRTKPPLSSDPFRHRNTIGMMPATWFNDTILIKLSRSQYLGGKDGRPIYCKDLNDTILIKRPRKSLDVNKWIKIPSEELIFKNGKLISRETKDIY